MIDPQSFITKWGNFAPWIILTLTLLAGLNVPISIDLLLTISALLAAHYLPDQCILLFTLFTLGCILSAWISYALGRFFGKLAKPKHIEKVANLHARFGTLTFFICRFIPFGVRNVFFMTTGFSKYPFPKFALLDALACTLWSSIFFFSVYTLGQNFESVLTTLKQLNIVLFSLFACIVLFFSWRFFKKRKKFKQKEDTEKS